MPPANDSIRKETLIHEWVRLLLGTLTTQGLRDVVVCPGSRNAPLIFGARSEPLLRCHSVIDERAAAFFALGLARHTQRPVVVMCTSGSAVSHFLPAVIEAHHLAVPLLILSADRPSHLQASGAPQTIVQTGILGRFAQSVGGWDEPSADPAKLHHWARKARQAWDLCQAPIPGPVHMNLPWEKPLEPLTPSTAEEVELHEAVNVLIDSSTQITTGRIAPNLFQVERFLDDFLSGDTPHLLTLGPVEPYLISKVRELGEHLGLPLCAEFPGIEPHPLSVELLSSTWRARQENRPKVLHFGAPLVSGSWAQSLVDDALECFVVPGPRYLEPTGRARFVLNCDIESFCDHALRYRNQSEVREVRSGANSQPHLERIEKALADLAPSEGSASEPGAVLAVLRSGRAARQLCLGNSLSVRLASWLAPLLPRHDWGVFANRGTNGIDGHVAHAAGIAVKSSEPTLAIIGDVAAAHDLSSLGLLRHVEAPLVLVIVDNAGGRIFEHLPGAALWSNRPLVAGDFLTPPDIDWQAAGAAFGITTQLVVDESSLESAVERGLSSAGSKVVVVRTDPQTTREFLNKLRGEN